MSRFVTLSFIRFRAQSYSKQRLVKTFIKVSGAKVKARRLGGGGECAGEDPGGYPIKFYTGRFRPELQTLTL